MTVERTLGQTIKAARLGYHWSTTVKGFVRISGCGPFRIDVAPAESIPTDNRRDFDVRLWWLGGEAIVQGIKPLQNVSKIKCPFTIYIDDDGELI